MIADDPRAAELCQELIDRRGSWDNVSAYEASLMAPYCPGLMQFALSESLDGEAGIPYWVGPETSPDSGGGDVPPPATNEPINDPGEVFSEGDMNFGAVLSDIDSALISGLPTTMDSYAGWLQDPTGPSLIQQIEKVAIDTMPMFFSQSDTIQAGITSYSGKNSCWNPTKSGKLSKRAQVRIVRGADGKPTLVRYCRPKRMNPLNPRALRRAAGRLGSFHRIASNIEKLVQKACRKGIRRAPSYRTSCAPRRKGCR